MNKLPKFKKTQTLQQQKNVATNADEVYAKEVLFCSSFTKSNNPI